MKAILAEKYGHPEKVLSLKEIPKRSPKAKEILIKIHATTINDYDWCMVRGKPYLYRLLFGLFKPKHSVPGMELAGAIEGVGPSVQKHKIGDQVFGDISNYGFGTFAEYICIDENAVITKPLELSFEEAAAIPHASALALQALKQTGGIQENQKILINGGGGGVGTIALQLAKLHNCHVTGVDSHEKLEMMKSLGFDSVLDYKLTDFTKTGARYDLILDCKTNKSAFSYVKALKSTGKYVTIGGEPWSLIKILFWSKLISLFASKKLQILSLRPNEDLDYICNLVKHDKIKCEIDGPHKLEDTAKLIQYFGEGKHKGKVVIQIN